MSNTIVQRLLDALKENPRLEYEIREALRAIPFRSGWIHYSDTYGTLEDHDTGQLLFDIEQHTENGCSFLLADHQNPRNVQESRHNTLVEARQHAESLIPHMRVAPILIPQPRSVVGPWHSPDDLRYARMWRGTLRWAAVVEGGFETYHGTVFGREEDWKTTTQPSMLAARIAVDHYLFQQGLLALVDAEVDGQIPF